MQWFEIVYCAIDVIELVKNVNCDFLPLETNFIYNLIKVNKKQIKVIKEQNLFSSYGKKNNRGTNSW